MTSADETRLLEARNVTFAYGSGRRSVLEDVSLELHSGEILGLMAGSGRGKTTLCRLLAGYEKPRTGKILLNGKPLPKKGFCPVQMIWQNSIQAVDPKMRMEDILTEAGDVSSEIVEGLGIREDWYQRFPVELSGGELQRFCIARALRTETQFLLADEITSMLDYIAQCQIWNFLGKIASQRNMGILAVSHDRELLEQVCDRIVDM